MICFAVIVCIVAYELSVAVYTLREALIGAILANRFAIPRNELTAKWGIARMASEAVLVPMLTKRIRNYVLNISVTPGAYPFINAFLVMWPAILDDVLACNSSAALGAWKEVTRTVFT